MMTGGSVTAGPSLDCSRPTMSSLMLKSRLVSSLSDGVGGLVSSSLENGERTNEAKNVSRQDLHKKDVTGWLHLSPYVMPLTARNWHLRMRC